jgi:hypothetical protein
MDADMDDVEVQERIRQEVQARIDEEYDGEGPRDIANYVIVRPYQISRKDLVQTMDEYLDKAKNMLRNVALDIDGKD